MALEPKKVKLIQHPGLTFPNDVLIKCRDPRARYDLAPARTLMTLNRANLPDKPTDPANWLSMEECQNLFGMNKTSTYRKLRKYKIGCLCCKEGYYFNKEESLQLYNNSDQNTTRMDFIPPGWIDMDATMKVIGCVRSYVYYLVKHNRIQELKARFKKEDGSYTLTQTLYLEADVRAIADKRHKHDK